MQLKNTERKFQEMYFLSNVNWFDFEFRYLMFTKNKIGRFEADKIILSFICFDNFLVWSFIGFYVSFFLHWSQRKAVKITAGNEFKLQWAPLNGITLGPRQTDSINRMIPLTDTHIAFPRTNRPWIPKKNWTH